MVKTQNPPVQADPKASKLSPIEALSGAAQYVTHPFIRGIGGIKTDPATENLYLDFQRYTAHLKAEYTKRELQKPVSEYFKGVRGEIDAKKGKVGQVFRKDLTAKIGLYYPGISSEVRNKLDGVIGNQESGEVGEKKFNLLWAAIVKQIEEDQKKREEFEKSLRDAIEKSETNILEKISKNTLEQDEINKYQILVFFALISPFIPIPLFHPFAGFLNSFLTSGGVGNFLPSIFSTSGPLGGLASITDAMGLDDVMRAICNVLGAPLSIVDSVVLNPITTPIAGAVVNAVDGNSIIFPAVLALFANHLGGGGKGLLDRTFDLSDAKSKTEADAIDAKKALAKNFEQEKSKEIKDTKKRGEESIKKISEEERKIDIIKEVSEWLKTKYDSRSAACEMVIKSLFKEMDGDKKDSFAEELIKTLQNKSINRADQLLGQFHPKAEEDGFKKLLQLKASGRDNEVFNLLYLKEIKIDQDIADRELDHSDLLESMRKGIDVTKELGKLKTDVPKIDYDALPKEMDTKVNEVIKGVDYAQAKKAMEDEWDNRHKTAEQPSRSPGPPITNNQVQSIEKAK